MHTVYKFSVWIFIVLFLSQPAVSADTSCLPDSVEYQAMQTGLEAHNYGPAISYANKMLKCYAAIDEPWAKKQAARAEFMLGNFYLKTDSYPAAIMHFERAIELDNTHSEYSSMLYVAKSYMPGEP